MSTTEQPPCARATKYSVKPASPVSTTQTSPGLRSDGAIREIIFLSARKSQQQNKLGERKQQKDSRDRETERKREKRRLAACLLRCAHQDGEHQRRPPRRRH